MSSSSSSSHHHHHNKLTKMMMMMMSPNSSSSQSTRSKKQPNHRPPPPDSSNTTTTVPPTTTTTHPIKIPRIKLKQSCSLTSSLSGFSDKTGAAATSSSSSSELKKHHHRNKYEYDTDDDGGGEDELLDYSKNNPGYGTNHYVNSNVVVVGERLKKSNNNNNKKEQQLGGSEVEGSARRCDYNRVIRINMFNQKDFKRDGSGNSGGGEMDEDNKQIIQPKKLHNPIKESVAMQSIHRELMINQKIGRSVLNHKTELQKALEKINPATAECSSIQPPPQLLPPPPPSLTTTTTTTEHHGTSKKDEFQRILESRAKLIEEQKCFVDGGCGVGGSRDVVKESEFEKIHKRITNLGLGGSSSSK